MPALFQIPFRARRLPLLLIPLLQLGLPLDASAQARSQAEIDSANRAVEQIQREQQERQQQQLLKDSQRGRPTPPQELPEIKAPSLPRSGTCREIKEIVFSGVALLPASLTDELKAPYLGKCLYVEDIETLLASVLKAYIERGYIAVRPYLKAQDLNSGRLEILIVEGKVEGLRLQDDGRHSVNLGTAFPFVVGTPLNLRDIEQGLDQINRLASNNATMEVSPGEEPGESIVSITNTPAFPLSASASLNNLGSPSTGENQGSLTVSLDNPLRVNDFITYTHANTLLEGNSLRDSTSDSIFYSLPLGYWTLQFSGNASDYHTPVVTPTRTLVARGESDSFRSELNRVAYRDRDQKLTALVAITRKSSKNYLDDEFLSISSRKLTILDIAANWVRRFPGVTVSASLGWSKGLRWFDALEDLSDIDPSAPHAQGSKITYSGGLQIPFAVHGQDFSFSSQLTGQYALNPLYGSEQINIGSYYSVRGFNRYSLSGDRGYFLRNEVSTSLAKLPLANVTPRPFLGFDVGRIAGYKETDAATFSGAAAGVRFAGRYLIAEISAAKSIAVPDAVKREPARYSVTVTASF